MNAAFQAFAAELALGRTHLVNVPVADSIASFASLFSSPNFSAVGNTAMWTTAITLAIFATLKSLLSVKAIDELDPQRRTTDKNRKMFV